MDTAIKLYSFGKYDRSSKVRWMANEIGLTIEEVSVQMGEHRQPPYTNVNPYAAVPAVEWRGVTMFESSAIMNCIAEQFPDSDLVVQPDEPGRYTYLKWLAVTGETLEGKLVEYAISRKGFLPPQIAELHEKPLKFKLGVALEQMPSDGYLVGERLTLADIKLAYCLNLALSSGLIEVDAVKGYLLPLSQRPAAQQAEFFSLVADKL